MKKLLFILTFFLAAGTVNAQINWMTIQEALEAQKTDPKKIMMDVYTVWCGPCKMLDKNTFQNPDVAAYVNENYYAVKFNGEGNSEVNYRDKTFTNPKYDPAKSKSRNYPHEFAGYLRVRAYPTIVFFDESGNLITGLAGYLKPQQLELYLKLFADDTYKTVGADKKAWAEYQRNFVAEFKG